MMQGAAELGLHRTLDGTVLLSIGAELVLIDAAGSLVRGLDRLRGLSPPRPPTPYHDLGTMYAWYPTFVGGRWPDALTTLRYNLPDRLRLYHLMRTIDCHPSLESAELPLPVEAAERCL